MVQIVFFIIFTFKYHSFFSLRQHAPPPGHRASLARGSSAGSRAPISNRASIMQPRIATAGRAAPTLTGPRRSPSAATPAPTHSSPAGSLVDLLTRLPVAIVAAAAAATLTV